MSIARSPRGPCSTTYGTTILVPSPVTTDLLCARRWAILPKSNIAVVFWQVLCSVLGGGNGSPALAESAAAGCDEPGGSGGEERGGAGHDLQAGDGPAWSLSVHDPQARGRPRRGAADAGRRRGVPGRGAGEGSVE